MKKNFLGRDGARMPLPEPDPVDLDEAFEAFATERKFPREQAKAIALLRTAFSAGAAFGMGMAAAAIDGTAETKRILTLNP
jgi:hypothetical protein